MGDGREGNAGNSVACLVRKKESKEVASCLWVVICHSWFRDQVKKGENQCPKNIMRSLLGASSSEKPVSWQEEQQLVQ